MPHELKGFDRLQHDTLTLLIVGGVGMAVALAAFVEEKTYRYACSGAAMQAARPPTMRSSA